MVLDASIVGGKHDKRRAHVHRRNGDVGLVVFTEPLKEKETLFSFALNPDVGFEMSINGSFGGSEEVIHNGTDTTAYAGTNESGNKATFNSTDTFTGWPQAGTKSVKLNKPAVGNVWQFDKGSDFTLDNFIAISMFLYVDSGWTSGNSVSIFGFDTGTGLVVGNEVLLEDYFNEQDFGTVQKLSIPFEDMGIASGTIDAIRMEVVSRSGSGVVFYIDTMQFEETSGSKLFRVQAPTGTKFFVNQFKFTYIDAISTTLADAAMNNLSYSKILGLTKLTNGISFSRIRDGKALFSASITCLGDSTRGGSVLENVFSDNTDTHITLTTNFTEPVLLDYRKDDSINITINDDMTGLISFTAVAIGYTVQIIDPIKD